MFVGPDWTGTSPAGLTQISVPTNQNWTFISTQYNGPSDLDAVLAINNAYTITPLSSWGQPYTPPSNVPVNPNVDLSTPPTKQVKDFSAETFLNDLGLAMGPNPPATADAPVIEQFARIGLVPGQPFDWSALSADEQKAAQAGVDQARLEIDKESANLPGSKVTNGWIMNNMLGIYGTDYLFRAGVNQMGLGAELPQDQMYATTAKDGDGNILDGSKNNCTMHFDKDQFPPTNAIWSVTMYNTKLGLVTNPINKYNIAPDWNNVQFNSDGSLDIYIQYQEPTDPAQQANWLPAPDGPFILFLQDYWPTEEMISMNYVTPPVVKQ